MSAAFSHAVDGALPRNVITFRPEPAFCAWAVQAVLQRQKEFRKVACIFDIDHTIFVPGDDGRPDQPIPSIVQLFRELYHKTTAKIVLVTARRVGENAENYKQTVLDLYHAIGVNIEADERLCLICRDETAYPATSEEATMFNIANVAAAKREARAMIREAGYRTVLNLGDQPGDFDGGTDYEVGLLIPLGLVA